jgi:hypothetical protein
MPVVGVGSSPIAFSQAKFDQLKQQVDDGVARRKAQQEQQTQHVFSYIPAPKTESGPGGEAPNTFTPEWSHSLFREIQASGYQSIKLAEALFPFTYQGHMLNPAFHVLDPVFGGQKVDYHL